MLTQPKLLKCNVEYINRWFCNTQTWRHTWKKSFSRYRWKKEIRVAQKVLMDATVESSIMLAPPMSVRGMTDLDRNKFTRSVKVPRLEIGNTNLASVLPYVKKFLLKMENLKPVQHLETATGHSKVILFNPGLIKSWIEIDKTNRENLIALGINETNFKIANLVLKYENWKAEEIFRWVLPLECEGVSSFSKVGHIVHVNLKDHLLPYKRLIGQVLLDKIKLCRTVVNKIDSIDNTYRFFKMELLCGEDNMQCLVKENHCRFEFDFSKVYWNPRLCTEHERIMKTTEKGDILYDIFAGVGPFAIPCAKKKVYVFANDLNPESYKWLNHNLKLNKIQDEYLKTYNKDGREFIKTDLKNDLLKRLQAENSTSRIHITMNLPAIAVEFLNEFIGLFEPHQLETVPKDRYPTVYVYCFVKGDNPQQLAKNLVENHLDGFQHHVQIRQVFNVRNVSPKKEMMRVSFDLSYEILCGQSAKRRKLDVDDLQKYRYGEKAVAKEASADGGDIAPKQEIDCKDFTVEDIKKEESETDYHEIEKD